MDGNVVWQAARYGRQQGMGMAMQRVWVLGMGMAGMGMGMAGMGMECSGFCCMQEVLINSELKPFGERLQGKRDLLGATEVHGRQYGRCWAKLTGAPAAARLRCSMQEVLINSALKPFGERIEGKRDLLGATEVWQAVW